MLFLPPEGFPHVSVVPRALTASGCGRRCLPAGTLLQVRVTVQQRAGVPAVMLRSLRVIPLSHHWKCSKISNVRLRRGVRCRGEEPGILPVSEQCGPVWSLLLSPRCASSCSGSLRTEIRREQLICPDPPQPITAQHRRHVATRCCVRGLRGVSEKRQPKQNRFMDVSAWCIQGHLVRSA